MIPLDGAGDIATARRDRGRYIIEQPVVEERTTDMTGIAPTRSMRTTPSVCGRCRSVCYLRTGWITEAA